MQFAEKGLQAADLVGHELPEEYKAMSSTEAR